MDDPWANAWGGTSSSPKPLDPWSSSTLSTAIHDQEADIGQTPSWTSTTDPPTLGTDPTWTTGPGSPPLWSEVSTSASGWEPTPYDIPLGRTPTASAEQSDVESDAHAEDSANEPSVILKPDLDEEPLDLTPSPSSNSPKLDVKDDGDGFGTFESAEDHHSQSADPWTPADTTFAASEDSGGWGASTWDDGNDIEPDQDLHDSKDAEVDEWENAKRVKEYRDRQVPPELLGSIMQQLDQLGKELWPTSDHTPSGETSSPDGRLCSLSSLSDFLEPTTTRLLPTITLPPIVPFAETFAHKNMASALKLTRNVYLSQQSPMAFFLASKGRGEWEASLRTRVGASDSPVTTVPTKTGGDFATGGLGWRILGVDEREDLEEAWAREHSSKNGPKNKKPGGSWFWNRRSSNNIVTVNTASGKATPINSGEAKPASAEESTTTGTTPRSSFDSARSSKTTSVIHASASSTAPSLSNATSSKATISVPSTPNTSSPVRPVPPALGDTQTTSSGLIEPDDPGLSTSPSALNSNTPAPSAVSRFFGRFSRSKPSQPQEQMSDSKNSLNLSSSDIQFLDDVPVITSDGDSAGRDTSESDRSLLGESLLREEAVRKTLHKRPEQKLPPPLAPPPPTPPRAKASLSAATKMGTPLPPNDVDDTSFFDEPFKEMRPASPASYNDQQSTSLKGSTDLDFSIFEIPVPSGQSEPSPRLPPKDYPPPSPSSIHAFKPNVSNAGTPRGSLPPKRAPVIAVMSKASFSNGFTNGSTNLFSLPPPPGSAKPSVPLFTLPPPTSRPHTPPAVPPPINPPPVIPPSPQSQVPPVTPKLNGLSIFGDDDFADFASAPSTSSHNIPPSQLSSTVSSYSATFPSANSIDTLVSANTGSADDFDDFVSSPAFLPPASPSRLSAKASPLLDNVSQPNSRFPSPHISSMTPPTLPSSPLNPLAMRPNSMNTTPMQSRPSSRTAGLERTNSLVQKAGSQTGVWPAPRSPVPPPLSPPPRGLGGGSNKPASLNLDPLPGASATPLILGSSFSRVGSGSRSSTPVQPPAAAQSGVADLFGAPHVQGLSISSGSTLTSNPTNTSLLDASFGALASHTSPTNSQPTNRKAQLTAQDLSFFEGL